MQESCSYSRTKGVNTKNQRKLSRNASLEGRIQNACINVGPKELVPGSDAKGSSLKPRQGTTVHWTEGLFSLLLKSTKVVATKIVSENGEFAVVTKHVYC
jgi:hypothetical protein